MDHLGRSTFLRSKTWKLAGPSQWSTNGTGACLPHKQDKSLDLLGLDAWKKVPSIYGPQWYGGLMVTYHRFKPQKSPTKNTQNKSMNLTSPVVFIELNCIGVMRVKILGSCGKQMRITWLSRYFCWWLWWPWHLCHLKINMFSSYFRGVFCSWFAMGGGWTTWFNLRIMW